MKPSEPGCPHLTRNEREVLKSIIQSAKIPDADIAKKIGLSPQAVFKIRHKLEASGIIKGYQPLLDLKKLGVDLLVLLVIRLSPEVWENYTEEEIAEKIRRIPYVINAYRVLESKASHVLLMGFKGLAQMEPYLTRLQSRFCREVEIINIYPCMVDKAIAQSPTSLLYEILDKKEFSPAEFFLKKK